MQYRVKGRGRCSFMYCEEHATAKAADLEPKNVHYILGDRCPCCIAGFVQQWAHRDRGRCYRCNGSGIMGFKREFKGAA